MQLLDQCVALHRVILALQIALDLEFTIPLAQLTHFPQDLVLLAHYGGHQLLKVFDGHLVVVQLLLEQPVLGTAIDQLRDTNRYLGIICDSLPNTASRRVLYIDTF